MITIIWFAAVALAVASAGTLLVRLISSRPVFGLYLLALPVVLLWEWPSSPLLGNVFGSQVYLLDAIAVLLLSSAPFSSWRINGSVITRTTWALLLFCVCVSVLWGLITFGKSTPIVEARQQLWFFAPAVWAMSVDWAQHRRAIVRWAAIGSVALVAMSAYHAAVYGVGDASSFVESDSGEQVGRVLVSVQALTLVFFGWITAVHGTSRLRWILITAAALATLVSQQRTVWIVTLAMVAVGLLLSRNRLRILAAISFGVVVTAFIISIGAFAALGTLSSSATNDATYAARSFSWNQLIAQAFSGGASTVAFGSPYGSGFVRVESNGQISTFNPHNWYLTLFLRVGAIGLALFVFAILSAAFSQIRNAGLTWTLAGTAGLLVYGWTYNLPFIAAGLFGIMLSLTNSQRRPPALRRNIERIHPVRAKENSIAAPY